MNLSREDYLTLLESKLQALPAKERTGALTYYSNFIQNAADENAAMAELGTPADLATDILTSYVKKAASAPKPPALHPVREGITQYWWLLIILAVFAAPVLIGLGGGLFGLLVGLAAAIFSFAVSGVAFLITGFVSVILSLFVLVQNVGFGMLTAGTGFVFIGLGILLIALMVAITKGIFALLQSLFRRIGRRNYDGQHVG